MHPNDNTTASPQSSHRNSEFADHVAASRDMPLDVSVPACLQMVEQAYAHLEILLREESDLLAMCAHHLKYSLMMLATSRAVSREEINDKIICLVEYRHMFKDHDPRLFIILNTAINYECDLWNIQLIDTSDQKAHRKMH